MSNAPTVNLDSLQKAQEAEQRAAALAQQNVDVNASSGISPEALTATEAWTLQFFASSTWDGADKVGKDRGIRTHCDIFKVQKVDGQILFLLVWDNPKGLRSARELAESDLTSYRGLYTDFSNKTPSAGRIAKSSKASWVDLKKYATVIDHYDD